VEYSGGESLQVQIRLRKLGSREHHPPACGEQFVLEADVCQPLNFDQDLCKNGGPPPWKPTMGLGLSRSIDISSQLND